MKKIFKFLFFISFFMMISFIEVKAKDLEIYGVNFEKKYDDIFSKLYFHFFVRERSASLLDIAYIKNSDFVMCLSANIDWELGICDEYSPDISKHKEIQEQLLANTRIKPYVIYSSDKNFNRFVLWIDKDSGRSMKLIARADLYKGDLAGELCKKAIHLLFDEILTEYNKHNLPYNYYDNPWVRIGNYILEFKCFSWGTLLLEVEHDKYDSIVSKERKKLMLNIK